MSQYQLNLLLKVKPCFKHAICNILFKQICDCECRVLTVDYFILLYECNILKNNNQYAQLVIRCLNESRILCVYYSSCPYTYPASIMLLNTIPYIHLYKDVEYCLPASLAASINKLYSTVFIYFFGVP